MAVLLGFDSNYKGLAYNVSKGAYSIRGYDQSYGSMPLL